MPQNARNLLLDVKSTGMQKEAKFGLMFLCILPLGGYMAYDDHMAAERFAADGEVVVAKWNTKNHQMSLFEIKGEFGIKRLHHYRVTLTPDQIKIGDKFKKARDSKSCMINGVEILCVN